MAATHLIVLTRWVPETRDPSAGRGSDVRGALLAVLGLGAISYVLIEQLPLVVIPGLLGLAGFFWVERRAAHPLLPLDLFGHRQFATITLITFVEYAAIGAFFFLLPLVLQIVAGWSPLAAGASILPVTVLTFLLSGPSGALSQRRRPRLQLGLGPLLCAAGCVLSLRISSDANYLTDVLPAVCLFGIGLSTLVAPLTATALESAPVERAGVASAVNNAVARTGTLQQHVGELPATRAARPWHSRNGRNGGASRRTAAAGGERLAKSCLF